MKIMSNDNFFAWAGTLYVNSVKIHGLDRAPVEIKDLRHGLDIDKKNISYNDGTLGVTGLMFEIDYGLVY